jgi:hypothetical protein
MLLLCWSFFERKMEVYKIVYLRGTEIGRWREQKETKDCPLFIFTSWVLSFRQLIDFDYGNNLVEDFRVFPRKVHRR